MWQVKKAFYRVYQQTFRVAMCVFDWSEPTLLEGPGAIRKLPEFIKSKGLKKVLIVTDKGLMGIHLLDSLFEEMEKADAEEELVIEGLDVKEGIMNSGTKELFLDLFPCFFAGIMLYKKT